MHNHPVHRLSDISGPRTNTPTIPTLTDKHWRVDIWGPFVTFGYGVPGSPAAYPLDSAPSFSVGTSVQLDDNVLAIASYDFNGSISSASADSQQLFGSVSWIINNSLTLTAYAELGLSSGAPAQGTGLLVSWSAGQLVSWKVM